MNDEKVTFKCVIEELEKERDELHAKAIALTKVSEELHKFICEHLSTGMVATEQDKLKFDWYAPMQDGTLASYRQEIETHGVKEMGK